MAAITGAVIGAGSAIMSFNQMAKQNRLMTQAEADAKNAMAAARGLLDKNYMKQLSINKEPYENQREALLSQGAQLTEAGVESERGAATIAGKVQGQMNVAQQDIRESMGKDIQAIDEKIANEASRLRDVNVQLDLDEAAGQQQAARDAAEAKNAALQQGMASAASAIESGLQEVPLYRKNAAARQEAKMEKTAMGKGKGDYGLSQSDMQKSLSSMGTVNDVDLSSVSSMNPMQYKNFMAGLDAKTLKKIRAKMPTSMSSFNPNRKAAMSNYFSDYSLNPFMID